MRVTKENSGGEKRTTVNQHRDENQRKERIGRKQVRRVNKNELMRTLCNGSEISVFTRRAVIAEEIKRCIS